jgi:hypothetical protein
VRVPNPSTRSPGLEAWSSWSIQQGKVPAGAGSVTDSDKFGSCRSPVHGDPSVEIVDLNREFDRVFGDYRRVRLRSGLPTYLGRLTLPYGRASAEFR